MAESFSSKKWVKLYQLGGKVVAGNMTQCLCSGIS